MKSKNLFTGILMLFAGVVALLSVLGVFTFHWSIVWSLWPMMLIIFGIALLPFKEYLKAILLLVALGAGCLLYNFEAKDYHGNVFTRAYHNIKSWSFNSNDDDEEDEDAVDDEDFYSIEQRFSEPYADVETASIDIDFGAGNLVLTNPCAELAKVEAESNFVKYSFRTEKSDDMTAIYVSGKGHTKHAGRNNENDLEIALCDQPVWNFSLDMGAADAELDFSPYKVSNIEINGGACDIDMTLGDRCDTKVVIETGVSDIDIQVPENVDCQINMESAITGKDFPDFVKIERGLWQTPNYGQGERTIVIDINCAVSDISVKRY